MNVGGRDQVAGIVPDAVGVVDGADGERIQRAAVGGAVNVGGRVGLPVQLAVRAADFGVAQKYAGEPNRNPAAQCIRAKGSGAAHGARGAGKVDLDLIRACRTRNQLFVSRGTGTAHIDIQLTRERGPGNQETIGVG